MRSTKAMRDRCRELSKPDHDDYDRAVVCIIDDLEAGRPVWLRREGDHAIVLVEVDGEWREVIRERYDGQFSHIWEDQP